MEINYLAILVVAILNMILGSIWFGPLFGKVWMREANITPPAVMDEKVKKGMIKSYSLMFIGSLVMAYILSHFIYYAQTASGMTGAMSGVSAGFWSWLGFVVPTSIGVVLWEGKSWKSWAITYIYYLVALIMFGAILAVWK